MRHSALKRNNLRNCSQIRRRHCCIQKTQVHVLLRLKRGQIKGDTGGTSALKSRKIFSKIVPQDLFTFVLGLNRAAITPLRIYSGAHNTFTDEGEGKKSTLLTPRHVHARNASKRISCYCAVYSCVDVWARVVLVVEWGNEEMDCKGSEELCG